MISVNNLSKFYGSQKALDNICFDVKAGDIVGLLGANGAGKTTTMRILSGSMPSSSGDVKVAGFDVFERPLQVKRCIGYLPETNPLYPDMRVDEFLRFGAQIKGVSKSRVKERVDWCSERCWIKDVRHRLIGQLSKGYRQRVGLANALVHDPDLLILDEPTVGLDPRQIVKMRDLIKELGCYHTIVLSSHILSEVDAVCDRVIILNQGGIVAQDTPERLRIQMDKQQRIVLEIKTPSDGDVQADLLEHPGVESVSVGSSREDYTVYHLDVNDDIRENIFELCVKRQWTLRELTSTKTSLEDVFVSLTSQERERNDD